MKVLHVIHSLDPRSGGPSHAARHFCRAQTEAGHEVTILSTTAQSSEPWAPVDEYCARLRDEPSFAGVELVLQAAWGRRGVWHRFAYSPASRNWLHQRLADRDRRPDVIHIHGVFSHVVTAAARAARVHRIPYIIRPAGALDAHCFQSGRQWLKRSFNRMVLSRDLRDARYVHATSDAEADAMRLWVERERIQVIPLGVEVPAYDRSAASEILLTEAQQLRGRRIILFLSRVARKKRAEMLVDALALLRDEFPDVVLLIVGQDSGGMDQVRQAVARHGLGERVVLPGFLQGDKKRAAFAAAHVFALPSLDENFGIAVVEAMAHGLPVVVTAGVASHVFVDDCGCGCTVDDSAEALAAGLRRVLGGDAAALGRRGREYVSTHLAWPSIVQQLNELYNNARTSIRA